MIDIAKDLHFDVLILTLTFRKRKIQAGYTRYRLMRGVALNVRCIETLQSFNSDHRPIFLRVGPPNGEQPPKNKIITSWRKVSLLLQETDIPILNDIPDNIETTDEIDYTIGALTNHIATVVENSSREVPAADSRQKLPEEVCVQLKAKNAAMHSASSYPTCKNKSCAPPHSLIASATYSRHLHITFKKATEYSLRSAGPPHFRGRKALRSKKHANRITRQSRAVNISMLPAAFDEYVKAYGLTAGCYYVVQVFVRESPDTAHNEFFSSIPFAFEENYKKTTLSQSQTAARTVNI
ncbi:hypothetical protein EVAR_69911_1 [Eumeta japonica]|uniref:Uncharacterized protein n=1 Tax=Eumeta variegata TaxID=151549 RepID=A0A4C2ABS2_EUMVA|nr:hypothetical protein EVAR_69911_1 [Eumeta japonica]